MGRDLRRYSRQTTYRLVIGFILLLFLFGDGLIYIFYGKPAALTGLLCLAASFIPVILIIVALWVIEWIAKISNT